MTRTWLLTLGFAASCGPQIARGPAAMVEATAPVRLVEQLDAQAPNIYLQAVIAAGSARDPIGKEGLAALTATAMLEAGAGERSGPEVKDALFPTGNEIELIVDREWVSFRLSCHRDQADTCLQLFTDVITTPRFDPEVIPRLREEAIYAVGDGLLGDEEALGDEVLDAWLFEGHPYGHPPAGRAGVLPLLDADTAQGFHTAHYVREAVVAGIAGSYTPAQKAALQERLDHLPGERSPELVLQQPVPVEGRSLLALDTQTEVTGFHLGHPLSVTRDHPDHAALFLAFSAFGAHRQAHGRLFRSLRATRGLNYGTYAYAEPFVQRGWTSMPEQGVVRQQPYFSLWIRPTTLENGPFALKLAVDELERFVTEGLSEEEFEATRSYLLGHLPLEARDPGRRLSYTLDATVTGMPNLLELVPAALKDLTVAQVNGAISTHINPANLRIVAVSGDADALAGRLVEETSTPIVYNDVEPTEEQAARDAEISSKSLDLDPVHARVAPAEGIFR